MHINHRNEKKVNRLSQKKKEENITLNYKTMFGNFFFLVQCKRDYIIQTLILHLKAFVQSVVG